MQIGIPDVKEIIKTNKQICAIEQQKHICANPGKIESTLHSAFYPNYGCESLTPRNQFEHGGIASLAGALCFYLINTHAFFDGNKRTAGITASTFLYTNGYDLKYPLDKGKNIDEYSSIVEQCAASKITKEDIMKWFDLHKYKIHDTGSSFRSELDMNGFTKRIKTVIEAPDLETYHLIKPISESDPEF